MIVYISGTNVYGNVSLESTDSSITVDNAYTMSDFTIKDSNGNVIAKFVKTDGTITEVTE
jgi:hypothetical protein